MGIVLIGYRGAGKSAVGRKIADRLWQSFVDTDEMIVKEAGKPIARIFAEDGEPTFRELESRMIRQATALKDHVIAIGGGAVMRQENRDVLAAAGHRIIYLRCEPEVLLARINSDPATAANRPNLTNHAGSLEEIRQLLAEREPIYRQVMHAELDVTNLSVDEAAARIVRLI